MRFPKGRLAFDFNFTFSRNRTDPFKEIGLLVVHDREATIRQIAIHDHITIITEENIQGTQNAKFKANSDFGSVQISLKLVGVDDGLSGVVVVAIVIGSLLVIVGGGYFVYRWNLKRKTLAGKGLEESLIDRDTLNMPPANEDEDEDEESNDEEDEGNEDDDNDEEENLVEEKPQETIQSVVT